MRSEAPTAASEGGWERWGIHGRELADEEYRKALEHVTERVHAMVQGLPAQAA